MPAYFTNLIPSLATDRFFRQTQAEIHLGSGKYYIIARAAGDVFPHTGGIPVTFALSRNPK